ncbi:MAG: formate dehydrogenase accessory sulfurtransferase FdhD [Gammaproteobacteria bacterium]
MTSGIANFSVRKMGIDGSAAADDAVAIEEPLGIRLVWFVNSKRESRDIAVTMRTPGQDAELAAGFLFTEGLISAQNHISNILVPDEAEGDNLIEVVLSRPPLTDPADQQRNFFISSSCGLCGKASIEAVRTHAEFPVRKDEFAVSADVLSALPESLIHLQQNFAGTGSVHAAAVFDRDGLTELVYEDVGRHNAVDKLVGSLLLNGSLPLFAAGIFVSGRSSFELVQKSRMAGCEMLAAVGAPSSLAIELAREADMSLLGFVRDERFNVYAGPSRILP